MSLGTRIRAVRTLRGLSSADLAKAAGVSRGLISQIELDRANPSIDTLRRIATALESPIASFFDEASANGIVVRSDERRTMRLPRSGLTYQLLTPDLNRQIEFILIELEPGQGGTRSAYGHAGEEAALVLEGQLHVWIGDLDTFRLEGAVKLLKQELEQLGSDADVLIVEGRDHSTLIGPHKELWPKGMHHRIHTEMITSWQAREAAAAPAK